MVAATFAYYNMKFSTFNFIDFNKVILYESKSDIFTPNAERYLVLIYSSKKDDINRLLKHVTVDEPILAIDLAQHRFQNSKRVRFATGGMNTLLKLVHRFHVVQIPVAFSIEKTSNQPSNNSKNYKQDSHLELF
jgi:hypothetical protein